jgi:hypothetical protein
MNLFEAGRPEEKPEEPDDVEALKGIVKGLITTLHNVFDRLERIEQKLNQ